jgi:hypothetical protein
VIGPRRGRFEPLECTFYLSLRGNNAGEEQLTRKGRTERRTLGPRVCSLTRWEGAYADGMGDRRARVKPPNSYRPNSRSVG